MPPTIIHGKISTIFFSIHLFHSLLNAFVIFLFRDAFLHLKDVARCFHVRKLFKTINKTYNLYMLQ